MHRRGVGGGTVIGAVVVAFLIGLGLMYAAAPSFIGTKVSTAYATSTSTVTMTSTATIVSSSSSSSASAAQTGGVIKIGMTMSLTGTLSETGKLILAGQQVAINWLNDHGGIVINGSKYTFQLIYYDDASTVSNVVPLYTRLILTDKVDFLVGPYSDAMGNAMAPLSLQYDKLTMASGTALSSSYNSGNPFYVDSVSTLPYYTLSGLQWLAANHPESKIAWLYANTVQGLAMNQGFVNQTKSLNLNVVYSASYPSTVTDLSPELAAAKAAGADVLFGGTLFADGALMAKQLSETGWTPKMVFLTVATDDPKFLTTVGSVVGNGMMGPSQWELPLNFSQSVASQEGMSWFGPSGSAIEAMYENMTGVPMEYHGADYAGGMLFLAYAIQQAQSLNPNKVLHALQNASVMTFWGGFKLSGVLNTGHQMVVVQWQNAQKVVVLPLAVAQKPVIWPYTGS